MSTDSTDMIETDEETYVNPSDGMVKLPNGILTEDGEWIRFLQLREMTGVEEDLLTDRQAQRDGTTAEKIICNCTETLYASVEDQPVPLQLDRAMIEKYAGDLTLSDSTYAMVRLRMLSLGAEFPFTAQCSRCGHSSNFHVMLNEQPVRYRTEAPRALYDVTLQDGRIAKIKMLTTRDNAKLVRHRKQSPDRQLSMQLYMLVKMFDGKPLGSPEDTRKWSTRLRNELRASVDLFDRGMDVMVTNTCPHCSTEFEIPLPVSDEGFFFPSGLKKR